MSEPLVYVGRYKIPSGKLEAFKKFEKEIAEYVDANEPRILAYITYLNDDGTEATGIQIHADSQSMETHLDVIGPKMAQAMDFIEDVRIELYGLPAEGLRQRLTQMAEMTGVSLKFNQPHAGFSRLQPS